MPPRPDGVSVMIPCHNERNGLPGVLEAIRAELAGCDLPWEIVVTDDGSTDGSAEAVKGENVRLVRHEINLGYGAALKSAARSAQYDRLVMIDADATYPVGQIVPLVKMLDDCGMAVGARTGAHVSIPLIRRPAKWFITHLASFVTGRPIPDLNSGLRAVRWRLWRKYRRFFPDGFSLTSTITIASLSAGERVIFVPIDYAARIGSSKIRPVYDTLNFIQLILRTALFFNPLKIFMPTALALIGAGALIGFVTVLPGGPRFMDVTTSLLILTGVQILAIGGLADLVIRRSDREED